MADTTRIGIPYARQKVKGGRLFSVCPACGEWIAEGADEHGEPTNQYGEHWLEAGHTDEDVYGKAGS